MVSGILGVQKKEIMKTILRHITAPVLALALLMLSNGFFLTYVSAILRIENYAPFEIGMIQGSYYFGFLIAALKSEKLIQRIRHIRAFSFFASIATATTLLTVFANHLLIWMLMRLIMGICIAALYVVIESWLLIFSDKKNRGLILAIYMIGLYLSQSASQFIINLIQIESMMAYIVAGMLAALSILPVTFTRTTIPEIEAPPATAIFNFLIISPLGTIGAILSGMMLGSFYTFGPNFAQAYNFSIAYLMSITIAGGFLLQYPIGHLSDLFDRRRVVLFVGLMALLMSAAVIIVVKNILLVLAFSFVLGGFIFTIYPLSIAQVVDRTHSGAITTVAGVMLFAYSIGAVIGPLICPVFIALFNSEIGLYYFMGFNAFALTLVAIIVMCVKLPIPKKKQQTFVAIPPQSPVVNDLDPRNKIPKKDPSMGK